MIDAFIELEYFHFHGYFQKKKFGQEMACYFNIKECREVPWNIETFQKYRKNFYIFNTAPDSFRIICFSELQTLFTNQK